MFYISWKTLITQDLWQSMIILEDVCRILQIFQLNQSQVFAVSQCLRRLTKVKKNGKQIMYYNKFTRHEQVRLIRLRFEREKYLSKRSLMKHTCSWRVNLLYYEHWTDKQKFCTLEKTPPNLKSHLIAIQWFQ